LVSDIYWTNDHGYKNLEFDFFSYINQRLEHIKQFSERIASAIPVIRNVLKNDIHILKKQKSYLDLAGIDGSNTFPQRDPFLTTFSVNAISYLQYQSTQPPAQFLKSYELIDIPTSNFSNIYMHLRRDILEMRVFLELTDTVSPDIIFMDGSINAQAIWNARVRQLTYDPYVIPNETIKLYKSIFINPNGLWNKVINRLKSNRAIWIPKRIVGKSFISRICKQAPDLKLPQGVTNEVFSLILRPNEILGPFPFEKWIQTSTSVARKFVKDINTVYYKPPYDNASTIKLEFHNNFLPDLVRVLNTVKEQYSIYNKQITPIIWAHTLAKNENLDIRKLNATIQNLAIIKCIDPTLKNIIQARFSNDSF